MSDFLYSSATKPEGELSEHIRIIYQNDPPEIREFHGYWGSLAVSRNLYQGFKPFETESHIIVVIGGPVLNFRDNRFLTGDDPSVGTASIFYRYEKGNLKWDEDLSGPFVVLIVDKYSGKVSCTTDLMLMIPVYKYEFQNQVSLGTHVDMLAEVTGQWKEFDRISLADFIINSIVTYPYTTYKKIRQCMPAASHSFQALSGRASEIQQSIYWEPKEIQAFETIKDAAHALKDSISGYIRDVTQGMNKVGLFISGGEDARAVAGMLPEQIAKDSFVFLDQMNREGRIARKVAQAYGLSFTPVLRNKSFYLDILPEATRLIGSCQQYHHAHTIRLYKECNLPDYPAVFGGYLANAMIKAYDAPKSTMQQKMSFIYERVNKKKNHNQPLKHDSFEKKVLELIDQRRQKMTSILEKYRSDSIHEWFMNWPRTMGVSSPTIAVNRRLFRSYEPFLSNDVIKIAAGVPVEWKCNRRLFHKAMKPAFEKSKSIPHSKGWFPYYSWYVNIPVRLLTGLFRRAGRKTGYIKGHQGSWGDRTSLVNSDIGKTMFKIYADGHKVIPWDNNILEYDASKLTTQQKYNLLQTMYLLKKKSIDTKGPVINVW